MPKAVILAGGFGTRISEESHLKPKPMIEIGGKPILWHIMKHFHHYGVKDFIILAGYKQQVIKEYFSNYFLHTSDITFDFSSRSQVQVVHKRNSEDWRVTVVDTGLHTMTGGRLKRVKEYLSDGGPFFSLMAMASPTLTLKHCSNFIKKTVTLPLLLEYNQKDVSG